MNKVIKFPKQGSQTPEVVVKKARNMWTHEETALVKALMDEGLSPKKIHDQLPHRTIRQIANKIGMIKVNEEKAREAENPKPQEQQQNINPEGPIARMRITLGKRLNETPHGYILNGVPAGLYACIREANRILKANDQPQITGSPEWVV